MEDSSFAAENRSFLRSGLQLFKCHSSHRPQCTIARCLGVAAARAGMRVILTEETDWIGGQLTAQAVPPDEHPWIEQFGSTRSYRQFRNRIRDYYRGNYALTPAARKLEHFNPGNASVSRL